MSEDPGKRMSSGKLFGEYNFHAKDLRLITPTPALECDRGIVWVGGTLIDQALQRPEDFFSLYDQQGDLFYKKLDGLFCIVLFDRKTKKLLIANNPYQSTKCYYYQTRDKVVFSESLTEIVRNSAEKFEVYKPSVFSFLSNGFTSSEKTQLAGINKLLPTFSLVVEGESVALKNHWQDEIQFERKPFSNLEEKLDEYEKIYRGGLSNYLAAKKSNELGTLLSGGHDTSFALIQASQAHSKPVHAFTCTFPGWAFDEDKYARNICEKVGGKYHPIPVTSEAIDHLVSLIRTNEEPVVGSSLPLHILSQYAANHVDSMLGGDGGDTLWGEYYPVGEYHRYVRHWPLFLRKWAHNISLGLVKMTDWERFWELEHVASLFAEENYYDDFLRKLCTYRHFRQSYLQELFRPEFYGDGEFSRCRLTIPFNKDNFDNALIEGKLFNGFYPYQSFHTTKSMAEFGLELYLPTVQRDVIRFITNLPSHWVNGGTTLHRLVNSKTINRRFHKLALGRYLKREEIYNRSFDIPWYKILRPRTRVLELLKQRLLNRGWFNQEPLERLFNEFMSQSAKDHELLELKHHGYRIFTLLSLEIWCTEYLDLRLTTDYHSPLSLEDYLR